MSLKFFFVTLDSDLSNENARELFYTMCFQHQSKVKIKCYSIKWLEIVNIAEEQSPRKKYPDATAIKKK